MMPIYEYKCKTCGREFEYSQRISDNALTHCPADICECEEKGKGLVERKISKNIGLVFNGSGFYLTDYVHKSGNFNTSKSKAKSTETKSDTTTKPEKSASKVA